MQSVEHFETDRLVALRVCDDDFSDLCEMDADHHVMATLGGTRSTEDTRAYLIRNLAHWEQFGYGLWVLRSRVDGCFVGRGALRNVEIDGSPEIEVGYALMSTYWRQGIATEIARAIVSIAFKRLNVGTLVAFCLPTNVASRRVMEKAGAVYERDFIHAGLPHVLYRFRYS